MGMDSAGTIVVLQLQAALWRLVCLSARAQACRCCCRCRQAATQARVRSVAQSLRTESVPHAAAAAAAGQLPGALGGRGGGRQPNRCGPWTCASRRLPRRVRLGRAAGRTRRGRPAPPPHRQTDAIRIWIDMNSGGAGDSPNSARAPRQASAIHRRVDSGRLCYDAKPLGRQTEGGGLALELVMAGGAIPHAARHASGATLGGLHDTAAIITRRGSLARLLRGTRPSGSRPHGRRLNGGAELWRYIPKELKRGDQVTWRRGGGARPR